MREIFCLLFSLYALRYLILKIYFKEQQMGYKTFYANVVGGEIMQL